MKTNAACPGDQGRRSAAAVAPVKAICLWPALSWGSGKQSIAKTQALSQGAYNLVTAVIDNRGVSMKELELIF